MSECDELRSEIGRLRQEIAGLNDRFIPKSEEESIKREAVDRAKAAFPAMFTGLFAGAILPYSAEINTAKSFAELAKRSAAIADGKAVNAISKADLAANIGRGARAQAEVARTAARTADATATAARGAARTANRSADAARSAVAVVDGKVIRASNKAGQALRKSANALGIGNRALAVGGRALRVAGKALFFIDIIFGVISTLVVAGQLAALARRLNVVERSLNPLYGLIGVNKAKANAAQRRADAAYANALNAQSSANSAASVASGAQAIGSRALGFALQAVAVVGTVRFLAGALPGVRAIAVGARGLARGAGNTAQTALGRANQALNRPIPRGLVGPQGRPGARGQRGLRGLAGARGARGLRGLSGLRGFQGARGLRGQRGLTGQRGRRGFVGPQGVKGTDGAMNPADRALLLKIDATTTATRTLSTTMLARLQLMQTFLNKAWQSTRLNKLINLLTLVSVIHNAGMLSRDVGQTIGDLASNMLATVGVKDEGDNPLDINELVGSSVENFVKGVVGAEVYNNVSSSWQKASRIISSATMIAYTVRSLNDTSKDVMEWTAENTGKIGNALKKYGVVGERAYPWMSERVKAQDAYRRKFERVTEGLESLEDTASSLSQVTGNIREIQEEYTELKEQRDAFKELVSVTPPADVPTSAPESAPIANTEVQATTDSQSPDVAIADAQRGS